METATSIIATDPTVDSSQPDGSMTTFDASLQWEGSSATGSLLGSKDKTCIGTWSVRTMYETSKSAQVTSEMKRYRLSGDGQNQLDKGLLWQS